MRVASISLYLVILVCVLWGMAVTAFNVAFQAETIKAVPEEASAVAMSLFSGIFNLGIGCGTWLGGTVCNQLSIANIGYAGGIIGVGSVVLYLPDDSIVESKTEKLKDLHNHTKSGCLHGILV